MAAQGLDWCSRPGGRPVLMSEADMMKAIRVHNAGEGGWLATFEVVAKGKGLTLRQFRKAVSRYARFRKIALRKIKHPPRWNAWHHEWEDTRCPEKIATRTKIRLAVIRRLDDAAEALSDVAKAVGWTGSVDALRREMACYRREVFK